MSLEARSGSVAAVAMPETVPAEWQDAALRAPEGSAGVETLPEVLEQKYNFAAHALTELLDWADYALEDDPRYAEGVVNSLYYDTPDLAMYGQKRSSEYLKSKVRLRWYSSGAGSFPQGEEVGCYLEVKRKIGSTRRKQRTAVRVPAPSLNGRMFSCRTVASLADHALENGYAEHHVLLPVAHIQYRRRRYIDPATGARIAIDWDICCVAVNTDVLAAEAPGWLPRGVLEVKARMRHLPRSLEPVAFLLQKNSFSKYAQCLEQLTYPGGVRI